MTAKYPNYPTNYQNDILSIQEKKDDPSNLCKTIKETCEDSVAGLNRRANKIPPGIAINDAASKYSTGTPSAA